MPPKTSKDLSIAEHLFPHACARDQYANMQCTCTCVCMCMGVHVCEYMHTCCGPNLMFTTFFNASFILVFEMESLSQTLIYRACLVGQLVLGIPCLLILRLKLLNDSHMHPTFPWFLGIQTLPFLLVW